MKSVFRNDNFSFAHINPGSLKPHIDEIHELFCNLDIHALAVSETWFKKNINNKLISISGYDVIRHDRQSKKKLRGGGVALYLKSGLKYKIIDKSHPNTITEYLFVEIDNRANLKLALGVVYNPPDNKNLDSLKRCLGNITKNYDDCIILGDFNINMLQKNPKSTKFKAFLDSVG